MYDVIDVADMILRISKFNGKSMTPQKLIKLTYIAQGWSLGLRARSLFKNRIEAWTFGPMIPDLYRATRCYGRGDIPLSLIGEMEDIRLEPGDYAFLKEVFNKYGHLDGVSLSYITNRAGSLWDLSYDPNVPHKRITDQQLALHFAGSEGRCL